MSIMFERYPHLKRFVEDRLATTGDDFCMNVLTINYFYWLPDSESDEMIRSEAEADKGLFTNISETFVEIPLALMRAYNKLDLDPSERQAAMPLIAISLNESRTGFAIKLIRLEDDLTVCLPVRLETGSTDDSAPRLIIVTPNGIDDKLRYFLNVDREQELQNYIARHAPPGPDRIGLALVKIPVGDGSELPL